jgi:hypothetical protein
MIVVITSYETSAHRGGDEVDGKREHRRQSRREQQAHQRRGESTRGELALRADVEQPGAQSHGNGEAGERERRRFVENLAEPVRVAPGAFEQQPVHGAGVLAK